MNISEVRKIICCPYCKRILTYKNNVLVCRRCRLDYRILHDIPILINKAKIIGHLYKQINYFEKENSERKLHFHNSFVLDSWQRRYVEHYLQYVKHKDKDLIIDNASGSGYMALSLAINGCRVIATDLTFDSLLELKHKVDSLKLDDRVMLICCDSENLPFKDHIADGMIANAILEHLPREKKAIQEITRVLKEKARLMITVPLAYRYIWPFLWIVNWVHDKRIGHLRRYTRESILGKFIGFREINTIYTGHLAKVIRLLLFGIIKNSRFLDTAENIDKKQQKIKYGANNVVVILQKHERSF